MPAVFILPAAESEAAFWDDAHISRQMLKGSPGRGGTGGGLQGALAPAESIFPPAGPAHLEARLLYLPGQDFL